MHATLILILTLALVLIIRWFVKRRRILRCLEVFPNPPSLPLLGNALDLQRSTDILPKFMEYTRKYGNVTKLLVGPSIIALIISDYKMLEYLLNSTQILNKGNQYKYLSRWLGNGLLISDGNRRWKKHRKIIAPTFNHKIMENFLQTFESINSVLIKKFKAEERNSSFDVYPYIKLYTLDVICETIMGISINAQNNSKSDYTKSVKTMCEIMVIRSFSALFQYNTLYFFSKYRQKELEAVKILHNYTNSVIQSRRNVLNNKSISNTNKENEKLVFLDLLLQEKELDDNDIREAVDTFMFAGHDTSASAISFTLFCLAEHRDVQTKVVEELKNIFLNDKFRCASVDDLKAMKYLEAVIKETMRLYPPVPYIARLSTEDIPYDGHVLPKGITVCAFIYGIHRNKYIFPEPEKFIPERFIEENNLLRQYPYGYIPFSAGPRNCIGQKFAMLELKSVLSTILRYYQVFPAIPKHELVLSSETVLLSQNGIHIRIVKREF